MVPGRGAAPAVERSWKPKNTVGLVFCALAALCCVMAGEEAWQMWASLRSSMFPGVEEYPNADELIPETLESALRGAPNSGGGQGFLNQSGEAVDGQQRAAERSAAAAGNSKAGIEGSPANATSPSTPADSAQPARPAAYNGTPEGLPEPIGGDPPPWVLNGDRLVVDSRARPGGILFAQAVLQDRHKSWGKATSKPRWLRAILATNMAHIRRHGHAMLLRWNPTMEHTPFQTKKCAGDEVCLLEYERENFNWEKEQMMFEYLSSEEGFSHVFVLDADAALTHESHDTLTMIAQEMKKAEKEMVLTNEDWLKNGRARINGGFLFAASSNFTRDFFKDVLDAHYFNRIERPRVESPDNKKAALSCGGNEQLCLNGMQKREWFYQHIHLASGATYNRGGCVLFNCGAGGGSSNPEWKTLRLADPTLEIMHFMGASKSGAAKELCEGVRNFTEGSNTSYGCAK